MSDTITTSDIAAPQDAAALLHRFLRRLRDRRAAQIVSRPQQPADSDDEQRALTLADAAMSDCLGADDWLRRPRQVAVVGPTQTGKSSVVNWMLGAPVAEVSPLAGFTVHPQGFARGGDIDAPWTDRLFPGRRRTPRAELSRDDLVAYSLEWVAGDGGDPDAAFQVVWDTPDFDSLAATSYGDAVLESIAQADVIVLVLSKEKYSDLSVWRLLRLIEPLARPLVVCVNKLTPDSAQPVLRSVRERLSEFGGEYRGAPVVALSYMERASEYPPSAAELRRVVREQMEAVDRGARAPGACRLIRAHWDAWVAPIEAETAAQHAWRDVCAEAIRAALEAYERDFLNHPQRFDTFRRAVVELSQLLEPPRTAAVLGSVRWLASWPARQLFAARQAWKARRTKPGDRPHRRGGETNVLFDEIDTLLMRVTRDVVRRADAHDAGEAVWRALAERLNAESESLRDRLRKAADDHHTHFAREIRSAAEALYGKLQDHPALLNSLRAARVTIDVAGIALALKTAGVGSAGLLFAPAVFALTTMLTEGALGSYMMTVATDLKRRQRAAVERDVLHGAWEPALRALGDDLQSNRLFGIGADEMHAAAVALERWEASLS